MMQILHDDVKTSLITLTITENIFLSALLCKSATDTRYYKPSLGLHA